MFFKLWSLKFDSKKQASGDANYQRLESEFSHLPCSGLVVLLGPWMRHVVIIGSAPAQALSDRTSADLPRCAFVAFSMLCRGLVYCICMYLS